MGERVRPTAVFRGYLNSEPGIVRAVVPRRFFEEGEFSLGCPKVSVLSVLLFLCLRFRLHRVQGSDYFVVSFSLFFFHINFPYTLEFRVVVIFRKRPPPQPFFFDFFHVFLSAVLSLGFLDACSASPVALILQVLA